MSDIIKTKINWNGVQDNGAKNVTTYEKLTKQQALKSVIKILAHSQALYAECDKLYKGHPVSELSGVISALAINEIELSKLKTQLEK
jgi:hypothetical protein